MKRKLKDPYTYCFADGTQSTVNMENIGERWLAVINQMANDEDKGNRRETRRHVSIDYLVEKSVEPAVEDEYFSDDFFGNIENEELRAAISLLTDSQRKLLYKVFFEHRKQSEIAETEGKNKKAINNQYMRIIRKLKTFFGISVDF